MIVPSPRSQRPGRRRPAAWLAALAAAGLAGCPISADPDVNGDGAVNLVDAAVVASCWGQPVLGDCAGTDLDLDGGVDLRDLLLVVERFDTSKAPALLASEPSDGSTDVPLEDWLALDFASSLPSAEGPGFELWCGGVEQAADVHLVGDASTAVVNPDPALPPETDCTLSWLGEGGITSLAFSTAESPLDPPTPIYDRDDESLLAPVPDDFLTQDDPSSATGLALRLRRADLGPAVKNLVKTFRQDIGPLDGFSPIAPIVIELSDRPDPESLPLTPAASLEPTASVALFDLTEGGDRFGERLPFQLHVRSDTIPGQSEAYSLVIFPSLVLPPGGRVGLVMSRRVLDEAGRPFAPSEATARALSPAQPGESDATARVRELSRDVLSAIDRGAELPIPAEDVALALRITVRTLDTLPDDLLVMKSQAQALPPQAITIDSVEANPYPDVAAIIEGRWDAPDWRVDNRLARDANGDPFITGTVEVPFVLALPEAANDGPVPITIYQHGNPGSAQEVRSQARNFSARDGFAVLGFTDTLNRELGQNIELQLLAFFGNLLLQEPIDDFWLQTYGEQMAFLELILSLDDLDLLPLSGADEIPDLDVTAPITYVGISNGGNHGQAFMAYAPEIRAAALVTGGSRLIETAFHQDGTEGSPSFVALVPDFVAGVRPPEIWAGLSLFQMAYDRQDPHLHARFVYDEPLVVSGTTRRASILVVEGIEDPLVTNNSTRGLAHQLGPIPHLAPVRQPVPWLAPTDGPVVANIDANTSAAYVQYRPEGNSEGLDPDARCLGVSNGHYCGQIGSRPLQSAFFRSAVSDFVPVIESQRDE